MTKLIKIATSDFSAQAAAGKSIGRLITHNNTAMMARIEKLENPKPQKKIIVKLSELTESDIITKLDDNEFVIEDKETNTVQTVYVPPSIFQIPKVKEINTKKALTLQDSLNLFSIKNSPLNIRFDSYDK